jgi:hypothetical protein
MNKSESVLNKDIATSKMAILRYVCCFQDKDKIVHYSLLPHMYEMQLFVIQCAC